MEPASRNAIILARLSDLRDDNERAPPARSPRAMTMPGGTHCPDDHYPRKRRRHGHRRDE
jgi:hypothetical protein